MKKAASANRRNIKLIAAAVLCLGALVSYLSYRAAADPDIPILFGENGSVWIKLRRPVNLDVWTAEQEQITFRRKFRVDRAGASAVIVLRAFKDCEVFVDDQQLLPFRREFGEWREPRSASLTPFLSPGDHEIRVSVLNRRGPALLLAYSTELGIATGQGWTASYDGKQWGEVQSVDEKQRSLLSEQFGSTTRAFLSLSPFYGLVFAGVLSLSLLFHFRAGFVSKMLDEALRPARVRWALIFAWAVLATNNVGKLPLTDGFDAIHHYEYIAYIVRTGRIPLATEGWQMFQSPLYYLISAALFWLLSHLFTLKGILLALRVIPLVCGALQVEVCYRTMRHVAPERRDLQIIGTVVGGLMPMNLYISQYVGNEPLAGILSSWALVLCFALLANGRGPIPRYYPVVLGVLLGLAILTKATAILLILPIAGCFTWSARLRGWGARNIGVGLAWIAGSACLISGWFCLRNWVEFGKPFVAGWDAVRGIVWWQDPGYRTLAHFLSFREVLSYPVYAGTAGFWDSIYSTLWSDGFLSGKIIFNVSPPWNYGFMISGVLFALLPTAGILLGVFSVFKSPVLSGKSPFIFAAACLAIYFSAMIFLFATVPIYCMGKAAYTVGLLPCYALLCAAGLKLLIRGKLTSAVVNGLLACWAFSAYFSYFVLSQGK